MTEPCVFREIADDEVTLILSVHIDDMVVARKDADCNMLFDALSRNFPMDKQGELTW